MIEPLVSVEMITYNHSYFIARAIEGVLQQKTNFPFELVIGEDCSTDGTKKIVFDYQTKYQDVIRVVTSENNVGMKKNAYRTMKACQGKYIAFCEGDDYWHHPEKLQKQVDYLETHPECGLVFSDFDCNYVSANKLIVNFNYHRKGMQSSANLTVEQLLGDMRLMTLTAMIRRDLYEKVVEKDPYLHQNEIFEMGDTQLWTEIALISKVSYIPESLATYNALDESASHSKDLIKNVRFLKSSCEMRLYLIDKHNLAKNLRKEVESVWYDKILQLAFYERNAALASEVKSNKQKFSWKEWLWYFGAKNIAIHYGCRGAILLVNRFRRTDSLLQESFPVLKISQ